MYNGDHRSKDAESCNRCPCFMDKLRKLFKRHGTHGPAALEGWRSETHAFLHDASNWRWAADYVAAQREGSEAIDAFVLRLLKSPLAARLAALA